MSDASSIACHLLKSREKLDEIVIEDIALDGTNENVITERKVSSLSLSLLIYSPT